MLQTPVIVLYNRILDSDQQESDDNMTNDWNSNRCKKKTKNKPWLAPASVWHECVSSPATLDWTGPEEGRRAAAVRPDLVSISCRKHRIKIDPRWFSTWCSVPGVLLLVQDAGEGSGGVPSPSTNLKLKEFGNLDSYVKLQAELQISKAAFQDATHPEKWKPNNKRPAFPDVLLLLRHL